MKITSETLKRVVINKIFFSNTRPAGNINGQPVLDILGQRINGEWKNKTDSEHQLVEYLKFEYNDQPYFGCFDGECYQIGLFDVCHRPYSEVCEAFEKFAKRLYPLLLSGEVMTAEPQSILK